MARTTTGILLLSLSLLAALASPPGAGAQEPPPVDDGHGHDPSEHEEDIAPEDLTADERRRVLRLETLIVCKCPRENWTKSLAGCPDGCALEQKMQVRRAVKEGKTDSEILDDQVRRYGVQVLARAPASGWSGFAIYVLPFLLLFALAGLMAIVLSRSLRKPASEPPAPVPSAVSASGDQESDREIEREIDRELEEMD